MSISWDPALAMNRVDVDRQHREIFNRLDRMLTAMSQRKGRDEVSPLCAFLSEHLAAHFKSEEAEMLERRYPGYASHKREHDEISRTVAGLVAEYERDGSTLTTVLHASRCLTEYVRNHMQVADRELVAFVRRDGA